MPLLKLASSILLVLLVASLSALTSPPAAPPVAAQNQRLEAVRTASAGDDNRARSLAFAQARRTHGFPTPADLPAATIPLAGESVPGAGQ